MVVDKMDHYFYLEKHDQGKRISSSERMQEGISHTRWNQHNMSSYVIWGGWQQLEEFWLEIPGNEMCKERKEEIVEYETMVKEINIRKTKKIWQGYLHERDEDFDGV